MKTHAQGLAEQLAAEKQELALRIETMEREKLDMAQHLMSTEKAVQDDAMAKIAQVAREKAELESALEKVRGAYRFLLF